MNLSSQGALVIDHNSWQNIGYWIGFGPEFSVKSHPFRRRKNIANTDVGICILSRLLLTLFHRSLLLALQVVLSEVAALAHALRVVRPVGVLARVGHPGLSLAVVASVTHVLGVVLLVQVAAHEVTLAELRNVTAYCLQVRDLPLLEVTYLVLGKVRGKLRGFGLIFRLAVVVNVTLGGFLNFSK